MFKTVGNMSFRSKILLVLLSITFLLSIFSLILVHSISEVNQVSGKMKEERIPELVWYSHWNEELRLQSYLARQFVKSGESLDFLQQYKALAESDQPVPAEGKGRLPASLEELNTNIELLDFEIKNNVSGLIYYGDDEAARKYIQDEYLPKLRKLQEEIGAGRSSTLSNLQDDAEKFPPIIRKSLWLLLLLTLVALIVSLYSSYRISASLSRPIELMAEKVDQIAGGQYGRTLPEFLQPELSQLSLSINKMSRRLKESFEFILADKKFREQILNSLPVGIIIYSDDAEEYTLNTSAEKLLHTNAQNLERQKESEMENQPFWDLLFSKEICQNRKVAFCTPGKRMKLLTSQSQLVGDDQQVIGRIFYFIDITETDSLESRMHQSEKLALVGQIAAGAAHEIRNPLAVIHGFLSLMKNSFSKEENEKYHMELLMKELERINSIIEEMLLTAKPGAPIINEHYLEDIIQEILPLIRQTHDTEVIQFTIDLERAPLHMDSKQIKQVFHNLIRNSVESINGKGTVSISSSIKDNSYHIYFRDNGPGIPLNIQQTIFEPFSTSKEKGTGLGLTIVKGIIENHGGSISLISSSEEGTVFLISLPLR
ncbi:ATP-binding protein [Metabacillus sp. GX 13764]|uniref:sensor histidine kinase n=1 Tax=Metabacillus kandeliae TaxID=2900151 RepID=UPI001E3E4C57|nr:ATP-binding protein [Metabacillus kandeliae]MCD7036361.1 ATP-binding protein [Metabacillus kandeliae]